MNAANERIVAYLGGHGSFSEEACQRFVPAHNLMPLGDFAAVARAVCQGSADLAVLPVFNSLAGPIAAVHHLLAHPELRVVGEERLDIRLHLLGVPGATFENIERVSSHSAALAQCTDFLAEQEWTLLSTESTAEAARQVGAAADPAHGAIGSEAAATIYGLEVLAEKIQNAVDNITRFVIVERRNQFA